MSIYLETIKELRELAIDHSTVIVAFSGGKDSLCVLDMATRIFKNVVCFFMYFIPEPLEQEEEKLKILSERYPSVKLLRYPHWSLTKFLNEGLYCFNSYKFDDILKAGIKDIISLARRDTGATKVLYGARLADSHFRRISIGVLKKDKDLVFPIENWNKWDVLAFLKTNNLPIPPSYGGDGTGTGLSIDSILFSYDVYPNDYKKIKRYFPFIEAQVKRRELYPETWGYYTKTAYLPPKEPKKIKLKETT